MPDIPQVNPDPKAPPLPPDLARQLEERNRIASKLGVAGGLKVDAGQLAEAAGMLGALDDALGKALLADALKEVQDTKGELAGNPPKPEPSPERKELDELKKELQRLRDELAKRRDEGAPPEEIERRQREIDQLENGIERAEQRIERAEARARAQAARDLADRADALARGGVRPGQGNGDNPGREPKPGGDGGGAPPQPKPHDPDGGMGGGEHGPFGFTGERDVIGESRKDQKPVPAPVIVFVTGEQSVWAWDRTTQSWDGFTFGSPIVDVKAINGGLLAVAEHRACIYDFVWGTWLTPLDVPAEVLQKIE